MPRTGKVALVDRTVLAQRIVAARNARAWRQRDLARAGDFDQRQIASWEADITVPTLANAIRIADALEVSLDWLVGRTTPVGLAGPGGEGTPAGIGTKSPDQGAPPDTERDAAPGATGADVNTSAAVTSCAAAVG